MESQEGPRYPLTLSMLLFDSSGVNKDAALDEHRLAMRAAIETGSSLEADPFVTSGAIDWLLHDWLMAHRGSPESAAIEIRSDRKVDAELIVAVAAAGAAVRARIDPTLLDVTDDS